MPEAKARLLENAVAAVVHLDPYPWFRQRREDTPLYVDAGPPPRLGPKLLRGMLPGQTMARLLDVPVKALDDSCCQVHEFVPGITPGAPETAVALASPAAQALGGSGPRRGPGRGAGGQPRRPDRRSLGFGAGAHASPGAIIAIEIVAACARWIRARDLFDAYFGKQTGFRPLGHARVPVLEE